ncbi:MAG TPA: anthranilate synthase component I [Candidatus Sulfotelmatobacter sp.]|nr:anthranilate synthase component I [Candidatus Sulfotelmatobacter sp.]
MYTPSLEQFRALARPGTLVPVARQILADMETPVSAFRKIDSGNYGFLLESVEGGEQWGRYSFLGSNPSLVLRAKGGQVELLRGSGRERVDATDPFAALRALFSEHRAVGVPGLPRFTGGLVGYLGYDAVRCLERLPEKAVDDLDLPEALFLLTDTLLVFDNVTHRITVISNARVENERPPALEALYRESQGKIEAIIAALRRPMGAPGGGGGARRSEPASTFTRESFCDGVRAAKAYIAAGDIIQAVLSQRFTLRTEADPFDVYRALRVVNPSPYMYYLRLGDLRVVGSSPEMLVRLEGGRIDLRPIAGTRKRGADPDQDGALAAELQADPKERAEHIMLVDLGRNDVGKVARAGSVEVAELMAVERYSHVMHLVSHVRGSLEPGRDAFDVLRACFPAGTVTGAPKVRAMEIIEELEPTRRGPYAGAVGYLSFTGNLDTCITIRTLVFSRGVAMVQAGAGIVADSEPEREYEETLNKARALLGAIALAEGGLE